MGDVRLSLKRLARSRASVVAAIAALALGMGPAVGALVAAVELGFGERTIVSPSRVFVAWEAAPQVGAEKIPLSFPDFEDWRLAVDDLALLGAMRPLRVTVYRPDGAQRVQAAMITDDLFEVFGLSLLQGPGLDRRSDEASALLGERLWKLWFGGRADAVGKTLRVDGSPFTIVGVAPSIDDLPNEPDLWLDIRSADDTFLFDRSEHSDLWAFGRLRPGVPLHRIAQRLESVSGILGLEYPETNRWIEPRLVPLREYLYGDLETPMTIVAIAAAGVFLLASAIAGTALLVHALRLRRDLAVELALGAKPRRIARQLAVAAASVVAVGAVLAVPFAVFLTRRASDVPGFEELPPPSLAGASLGVAVLWLAWTVVFGLAVAAWSRRWRLPSIFLSGPAGGAGRAERRWRSVIVAAQAALAVAVAYQTLLLVDTVDRLSRTDLGFEVEGVAAARVTWPVHEKRPPASNAAELRALLDEIEAQAGVVVAGAITPLPLAGGSNRAGLLASDSSAPAGEPVVVEYISASPGALAALRVPLRSGRSFVDGDDSVALVDRSLAARLWPGREPIGASIRLTLEGDAGRWRQVVGVVDTIRAQSLLDQQPSVVFVPLTGSPGSEIAIVALTEGDPASSGRPLTDVLRRSAPLLRVEEVTSLRSLSDRLLSRENLLMRVLKILSGMAFGLFVLGTYALSAYTITWRRREIGLRMSLGADRLRVATRVLRDVLALSSVGVAIGLAAATLIAYRLRATFHGMETVDLSSALAVLLVTFGAAVAGAFVPAYLASKVDPARVLAAA